MRYIKEIILLALGAALIFSSAAAMTASAQEAEKGKSETVNTVDPAEAKAEGEQKAADAKEESVKAGAADEARPDSLTVASWGGAYTESQKRAYFAPFESESGIAIRMVSHRGRFAPVVESNGPDAANWDIVDLDWTALKTGCEKGTLATIEHTGLAKAGDGTEAASDFIKGSLHDCGVASVAWSSAIVFDKRAFKKNAPKSAADFFDTKRFPGERAIPRNPRYMVELALMADGVKPDDVYTTLETDEGLERAFKMLDGLKDNVTWWHKANQPLALLAERRASMALAFNGRIFSAIVAENKPFGIIWDAQLYHLDYWAVPKASQHKKASLDFIAFATRPENLARQASWFPYGPVRKSAIGLVGKHPEIDIEMAAYLPTAPKNFERALKFDEDWWNEHAGRVEARYVAWIDSIEGSTSFEDEQNRP